MKASQTETVIMLTCCALQSACYSPTGIVISFILAQFQGEVQTNLTAGTRKKCAFHRARRFRMPAAIGLRHPASASCLGRHLRLAGRCPNNSSLLPPLAAVVVVALCAFSAENHLIFRVSGKSAELVGAKPLHLLTQTALPLKSPTGAFIAAQTRTIPNPFSQEGS